MPPQAQRKMPAYSPSFGSQAIGVDYGAWKIFAPGIEQRIELVRSKYDKQRKSVTVLRFKPCPSFADYAGGGDFMPYRMDPGGAAFHGFWNVQLTVAKMIGEPAISFIVHRPRWAGGESDNFNATTSPLSILVRAVIQAIKRGQGKNDDWRKSTGRKTFVPSSDMLMEWSGTRSETEMKSLTAPTTIMVTQPLVPQLDNEVKWGPGKAAPGWGEKTCVFILTGAAGATLLKLCNQEKPDFRGNPADFENRYVNGDPIDPRGGRYLFLYPQGGDPRTSMANVPTNYDPLAAPHAGGAVAAEEEHDFSRYEMHFEKEFQTQSAAFLKQGYSPEQCKHVTEYLQSHWIDWADMFWFPTEKEQVTLLSKSLPLSMIDFAFTGEHDDWISDELRQRIAESRVQYMPPAPPASGYRPAAPPTGLPGQQPGYVMPGQQPGGPPAPFDPLAVPPGWNSGTPNAAPPPAPFPQGSTPFDGASPDQALPPLGGGVPAAPAASTTSIDNILGAAANSFAGMPPLGLPADAATPAPAAPGAAPAEANPMSPAAMAAARKAQQTS